MPWPVTLNGRQYKLSDFAGTAYVKGFPDALADFVTQAASLWTATSTTSMVIGGGDKTIQTQPGKPWLAGSPLRISAQDAPGTAYMDATVKSYDAVSGQLVATVVGSASAGTQHGAWNINAGGGGYAISGTVGMPQGGTGATNATDARSNLGLGDVATRNVATAGGSGNAGKVPILDSGGLLAASMIPSGAGGGGTVDTSNLVTKNANSVITVAGIAQMNPGTAGVLEIKATSAIPALTLRSPANETSGWFVDPADGFLTIIGQGKVGRLDVDAGGGLFLRNPGYPGTAPNVIANPQHSRGSLDITGAEGGHAGFYFVSVSKHLVWDRWEQGAYEPSNSTWDWRFQNGALIDGTVSINRVPDIGSANVNSANYAWGSSGYYGGDTLDTRINRLWTDLQKVASYVGYVW